LGSPAGSCAGVSPEGIATCCWVGRLRGGLGLLPDSNFCTKFNIPSTHTNTASALTRFERYPLELTYNLPEFALLPKA